MDRETMTNPVRRGVMRPMSGSGRPASGADLLASTPSGSSANSALLPRLRGNSLELTRAQQHDQLPARAVEAHGGDAALLHVDAPPGEVVDDLGEVRLVADHQHALFEPGGGEQLQRGLAVEARGQGIVLDRLGPEGLAGKQRGLAGADLGAREGEVNLDLERGQG